MTKIFGTRLNESFAFSLVRCPCEIPYPSSALSKHGGRRCEEVELRICGHVLIHN